MANKAGTLEIIAQELGLIIQSLNEELGADFFNLLGLRLPGSLAAEPEIKNAIEGITASSTAVSKLTAALIADINNEQVDAIAKSGKSLLEEIILFVGATKKTDEVLKNKAENTGELTDDEVNYLNNFSDDFVRRLLDFLIIKYIENKSATTASILDFMGIAGKEPIESPNSVSPPYYARTLYLNKIFDIFNKSEQHLKDMYGWGTGAFDAVRFLSKAEILLKTFGLPVSVFPLGGNQNLEAFLFALSENKSSDIPQLDFELRFPASRDVNFTTPIAGIWKVIVSAEARFDSGLKGTIKPPFQISINPPTGTAEIKTLLGIAAEDASGSIVIFGKADASRLSIKKFKTQLGLTARQTGELANAEPTIQLGLEGGKLLIDPSQGDGFLQDILSGVTLEGDFDLTAKWTPSAGLQLMGSAGIEVRIPSHIDLGILVINSFVIGLVLTEKGEVKVETSTLLTTNLGPLKAVIERIGANAFFSFSNNRDGNLGPINLSLGFQPPKGIGLSLDAGPVKGGGYLYFDLDREEYAGALELVFSEWIALKAIGVVTTKMPDGSKGFSMVIIITAEFGSGLQLGFGFTLLGVGGIVGINRVVNVEPLKVGVRTGALESILFPQDVVANAPRIISDLKAFFPVREGQFLIGPMAKIGYGTPTLASLSLGLIIEFPDVNITILGVLKVALPTEEADILRLQVNFLGRIEPANSLLWFYAELYDSRILFITLEGGMGLLVNWGDNANFVFSVGGFHPQYTPPPLPFPSPPRLAVNILNESYARVRIEGYFAVTSNSVQFGAHVGVFFGVDAFNIDGHFGFDALFQFDPFYFSFSLTVSLSVKLFGLGLFSIGFSGLLEGPTPWHIKGHGSIGFLFFSVSVPFEETWGEPPATPLTPIKIFPLIEREFTAITNWQAVVPKGSSILVTLRKLEEPAAPAPQTNQETDTRPLVLHPVGSLRISQRKMPINFKMDKLGSQKPADVDKILIGATIVGAGDVKIDVKIDFVKEKFARGEYQNLDQAKKLSSPGFEMYDGGIELRPDGGQLQTSMAVKQVIRYETIIIDSNYKRHAHRFFEGIVTRFGRLTGRLFGHFIKGSVVTQSTLSATYQQRIQPNAQVIAVAVPTYSVAYTMDNSPMLGANGLATASFASKAEAVNFMQSQIVGNPRQAGALHVIPNTELNQTAAA